MPILDTATTVAVVTRGYLNVDDAPWEPGDVMGAGGVEAICTSSSVAQRFVEETMVDASTGRLSRLDDMRSWLKLPSGKYMWIVIAVLPVVRGTEEAAKSIAQDLRERTD